MKDLSIYIHIPFCIQKCIYCNFVSFSKCDEDIIKSYFNRLEREIRTEAIKYTNYQINTIFIGGGTPSFVKLKYIKQLVKAIKDSYKLKDNIEFSIECNPNSVTKSKIRGYKELGINRVSIGLQASQDKLMKMLNRPHTKKDFEKAIKVIKNENIKNINVDILIGIPNQTFDMLKQTVDYVLSFNISSISAYGLIVEEDTPLCRMLEEKKLQPISENDSVKYYDYVYKRLKEANFKRYEVSNFALKGRESIHNIVYWTNGDYVGYGLSSHSKIADNRFCNTSDIKKYISSEQIIEDSYILSKKEKFEERIMLSLRMEKGINIENLNKEFNINFLKDKEKEINFLTKYKLIYIRNGYLKASVKGFKVLNSIIERLT